MKKLLLYLGLFLITTFSMTTLLFSISTYLRTNKPVIESILQNKEQKSQTIVASPIDNYNNSTKSKTAILSAVGKGDSRPVIIDNFLASHRSPMSGLGSVFVSTADKYGLDYRLLPAIAFQESTLGKKIPRGSHNAWGWAIYTGTQSGAKFRDWPHAIDTVARGLKYDYIDRGLLTPEAIMTRYSDSDGSWAFGVQFAMDLMSAH